MAGNIREALDKLKALPGFPFGGPMCAPDLCDHNEFGEPVNDDWGLEARQIIAQCVNFVCENFAHIEALEAERDAQKERAVEMERQRDDYLNREWQAEKAKRASEKDAARYRWIVSQSSLVDDAEFWLPSVNAWHYKPGGQPNEQFATLDAAIDQAMQGTKG